MPEFANGGRITNPDGNSDSITPLDQVTHCTYTVNGKSYPAILKRINDNYTCNLPRSQDVGPDKTKHTGMNHDGKFCRDCWAAWDYDTDEYRGSF